MSSLPPEIWHQIFAFATYAPGSLEDHPYNLLHNEFGDEQRDRQRSIDEYFTSLAVKCALVRVCSTWRTMGNPYLYEDLRFLYDTDLEKITCRLWNMADKTCGEEGLPVGRFTKRLDISWQYVQYGNDAKNGDQSKTALVEFLTTCHQLIVFRVDGWILEAQGDRLNSVFAALSDKPLCRLRFVHFGSIQLEPLFHLPTLVSLTIPLRIDIQGVDIVPMTLPNVQSMTFDFTAEGKHIPLHTPNLRHLSLIRMAAGSDQPDYDPFPQLVPFFERNGEQLLSLHLEYRFYISDEHAVPRWGSLPLILDHTPKLTELIVAFPYIDTIIKSLQAVSATIWGIRTLGLIVYDEPDLLFVHSVKERMPDLSTIRFSCVLNASFSDHASLTEASKLGVRIEDRRGYVLN